METPGRPLTPADRERIVRAALADGTVTRLRETTGWTPDDLARRCNVNTSLIEAWETGRAQPSTASALKLWQVLIAACVTPFPGAP